MKTIFAYLILSFGLFSLTFSQTLDEKDREMFKKHHVKSRSKWDYNFKGDKPSLEGKFSAESFYDKEGRVLKSFAFNLKGDTTNFDMYAYDARGNRVLYERKSLHGEYKKESEYNHVNNVIEEVGYDGGETFQTIFRYDSENRVLDITYLISKNVDEKRVYTYSGNKATVEILKLGKHLTATMELLFNDQGNVLEEKWVDLNGAVLEKKVLTYNSRGDVTREEKYKSGNFFYRINYEYDAKGELLNISEESKSKKKFVKKKFAYDDLGRIIEYQWKRRPDDEYNIKRFKYSDAGVCSEEHTYYPRTDYKLLTKYEYKYY